MFCILRILLNIDISIAYLHRGHRRIVGASIEFSIALTENGALREETSSGVFDFGFKRLVCHFLDDNSDNMRLLLRVPAGEE